MSGGVLVVRLYSPPSRPSLQPRVDRRKEERDVRLDPPPQAAAPLPSASIHLCLGQEGISSLGALPVSMEKDVPGLPGL